MVNFFAKHWEIFLATALALDLGLITMNRDHAIPFAVAIMVRWCIMICIIFLSARAKSRKLINQKVFGFCNLIAIASFSVAGFFSYPAVANWWNASP